MDASIYLNSTLQTSLNGPLDPQTPIAHCTLPLTGHSSFFLFIEIEELLHTQNGLVHQAAEVNQVDPSLVKLFFQVSNWRYLWPVTGDKPEGKEMF